MAQQPTVRWNEKNARWMAWVRFPDGSRRKVERTEKAEAQRDLDELLALRAQSLDPGPRRQQSATFDEVIDAWFEVGCPNVSPSRAFRCSAGRLFEMEGSLREFEFRDGRYWDVHILSLSRERWAVERQRVLGWRPAVQGA